MRRLSYCRPAAVGIGLAVAGVTAAVGLPWRAPSATASVPPAPARLAAPARPGSGAGPAAGATEPRLVVPDVIASVPGGVSAGDLARLARIASVRATLPIAGGRITVNGRPLVVMGAPAARLRSWTPPDTADDQGVWSGFAAGDLIATPGAARAAGLRAGRAYPVSAAIRASVRFGGGERLGIAGVDGIVSDTEARRLGLVRDVAVLVNAPAANMPALAAQVRAALGPGSQAIRLVPASIGTTPPAGAVPPASTGVPSGYLDLFRRSAARYCPGLPWTVLAAIGQIESGDGANNGPSTAGALGPMQFMPSTWRLWGITGFGQPGPPDIMNPLDAVPSAARLLCAAGGASGGQRLRQAIFTYNHATWYVDEVLTLAGEYANAPPGA